MRAGPTAVTAFLTAKLTGLVTNLVTFPVLRPQPADLGDVSLLVPLRNEAHRLGATLPGILAQGSRETLLLDDRSTDWTAALLRHRERAHPRVQVLSGDPRPDGWAGKPWALHQLAAAATGEVLAFCDADVHLDPGALAAAVAELRRQRADVLSVFPRQRTVTLGERLLVPLVDDVLLCFLPFPLLTADVPSAATANGSLLVMTRAAYERVGGFAALRAERVEDVALARRVRRHGLRLGLALGGDLVGTRMFRGYREAVDGLGRGLLPVAGSRIALVAAMLVQLAAYTLPWVLARRHRWWLPAALGLLEKVLVEAKTGRGRWADVLLVPAGPVAAVPLVLRALGRRHVWKGRVYR